MNSKVTKIESCRSCGNDDLTDILSLGNQYVSNFVESEDHNTVKAPLELVLCNEQDGGCGLLQLKHTVDPDELYEEYWYKSGINESMVESLKDIAEKSSKIADLEEDDVIIDIGCNDGTLLEFFPEKAELVGIDPAENIVQEAKGKGDTIINDYFNSEAFREEYPERDAKLITSISMFYDLDNPNSFIEDIKECLAEDGVWIIQMAYLPTKLENNAFDSICHEHLEYYSLLSLENLLNKYNLEIFDLELNDVNGGSFRTYIRKKGAEVQEFDGAQDRLESRREAEREIGLNKKEVYNKFGKRVRELKNKTVNFIENKVDEGETVYVYGASTKGNTLLQYYGLDKDTIAGAAERNPDKYGKKTVGTMIPIVPEKEARKKADYFLALPWHFIDVFKERERDFLNNGGKFIVPLPEFKVIDSPKEDEK